MGEHHTLEEHRVLVVAVLLGIFDVAAHSRDPACNVGNDARTVGAGNEEDGGV